MATAVHKKQSESKYVSCFADSRPDVDITFRDVLLTRPTDHYLVGIDNFSMTNTSLSMIEPKTGHLQPFIRILKRMLPPLDNFGVPLPVPATEDELNAVIQTDGIDVNDLIVGGSYNFSIDSSEVILSVQGLMHRLNELAGDVSTYMNASINGVNANANGADFEFGGYIADDDENFTHLYFDVKADGRLTIQGSTAFWALFVIEIPAVQDQFGLFGERHTGEDIPFTRSRRYLTLDPISAMPTFSKYLININKRKTAAAGQSAVQLAAYNAATIGGATPGVFSNASVAINHANSFNSFNGGLAYYLLTWTSKVSIFSSLERRVALEVGCSLPIKNSPMVDHQRESPDFVLARWIWRVDPRVESNAGGGQQRYSGQMPACTEYQGSMDRICYHELQPQSKIQTLRIKLFARLRSFDESTETYTMRVIDMPTQKTDWWHTRVHFMSKD